ncbi:hypothetical protein APHAL10511_008504 [Amanita phalloides]|nr:hypothetical protein APHAL10511_008504 [Amanita phalloides]
MTRYNAGTKEKVDGDEASLFTLSTQERSVSRGRDAFQSSGRGGVGNIRRTSVSRDARPDSGPDDFSTTRGREPRPTTGQEIFSTGRGGAGNMRSPSREVRSGPAASTVDAVEDQVIRSHKAAEQIAVHSTGRGGIGNMASSRSRSRARESTPSLHPPHHPHHPNGGASGTHAPSLHSTGRGGAGNILSGHTPSVAEADENQGGKHLDDEIHSTGRGGAANIVLGHIPPVEHTHHLHGEGAYESTGRGETVTNAPAPIMFSTRSFVFILLLPLFVAGAPPNWRRRSPLPRSLDVFPQMNGPTMMISESQVMASRRGFEENRASKPKAQIKRRSPGQSPQPAPDEQAGLIPLAGTLPGRTKYGPLMKGEDEHKDWSITSTPGAHHDIAPPSKQKGPSFEVKGSAPRRGPRKNTRWVNSEVGADNSFDYAKGRKEDTPRRRRKGPGKPAGKPASARPRPEVHNKQTSQAMSLDEPQPAPGHNKQAESPPGLPLNEDEMHGLDPAFWLNDHIHSGSRPHN